MNTDSKPSVDPAVPVLREGHTPGPWTVFYKHKYDEWHVSIPLPDSTMRWALFDDGIRSENPEADARLIAAAPKLLAALKGLLARHGDGSSEGPWAEWDAAVDAVAKATGTTEAGTSLL